VKLLGKKTVMVAAFALICYISLESTMNTWIKSLTAELLEKTGRGNFLPQAGFALSLFGICMMFGRFISSAFKNLTRIGSKVIAAASFVSMFAIILMMVAHSYLTAIFAIAVLGFCFAPIFPIIVGVTFARFDPGLYGSIFGIIFQSAFSAARSFPNISVTYQKEGLSSRVYGLPLLWEDCCLSWL
jgi:fucose permease